MPDFVADFAITQGSDIEVFTVVDSHTGTDAAVVSRRVLLQLSDGSYLVPAGTTTTYIAWPGATIGDTLDLDVLDADYAISILVQWLNVSNAVLYSKEEEYGFSNYEKAFLYDLTAQRQASNPTIIQDTNYLLNKLRLFECVVSGDNAIEEGGDIASAQQCYDRGEQLMANENINF